MLTRRALVLAGAAGIGVGVLARSEPLRFAAASESGSLLRHWVLDASLDRTDEFRRAAQARGLVVGEFEHDIGELAMRFDALWGTRLAPLAGVTRASDLFILEQLASRRGMSTTFTAEHCYRDGCWHHAFQQATSQTPRAASVLSNNNWRAVLCDELASSPLISGIHSGTAAVSLVVGRPVEQWSGPTRLLSWVIGPAR